MEDTIHIREAGLNDVPAIRSLAESVWPVTYKELLTPLQIEYMLALFYREESLRKQMDHHTFLMASLNERNVGFASYSEYDTPSTYKLHKLYIVNDLQGKGVGRMLVQYIIKHITSLGAQALILNVNRNNKARLFYEKLGFTIIGQEDLDIGEGYFMTDYVMRLGLGSGAHLRISS